MPQASGRGRHAAYGRGVCRVARLDLKGPSLFSRQFTAARLGLIAAAPDQEEEAGERGLRAQISGGRGRTDLVGGGYVIGHQNRMKRSSHDSQERRSVSLGSHTQCHPAGT